MVVQLGNINCKLAQVPLLTMMCIIIKTKTFVKIVLEQTCALLLPKAKIFKEK